MNYSWIHTLSLLLTHKFINVLFVIEPSTASTTISIRFISLLTLFIHAWSFILFSCTVVHRRSFIFCLCISPRSLSFTLVTSFYLLLCIPPVGQAILFYLLGNIKYRVCLLASGQPIFRGSSQRENEERFTTSISILSYRILLTESGRRVDCSFRNSDVSILASGSSLH